MSERIDITQKEPVRAKKTWKRDLCEFLFYLVQWTWGLPVNLVGGIAYLICTRIIGWRWQHFGYAYIVYVPWNAGGLSMGLFIFMRDQHPNKKWTYNTRIHEYGHTWQCLLLGPLYYLVIALPSAIWCNCFAGYRKKKNVSYYKLYCESWANSWGEKASKMKMVDIGM
ncbi:MAG: hypothetical protein IJ262_02675 [Clostridia bacterium]|nr:hypothetical protein [Clostridia bacterium]